MSAIVDALTAIRIDLSSVLVTSDLPSAKKRLEASLCLLDDTLSSIIQQARERADGHDRNSELARTDIELKDLSPRGSESLAVDGPGDQAVRSSCVATLLAPRVARSEAICPLRESVRQEGRELARFVFG